MNKDKDKVVPIKKGVEPSPNDESQHMADIVVPNHLTTLDLPPDRVLDEAMGKLEGVIVLGTAKDGSNYYATTYTKVGVIMFLIEKFKKLLLED